MLRDVAEYASASNAPVAILSLDQEKAFDCVDWGFMRSMLSTMGFGPSFISWVDLFYSVSRVLLMLKDHAQPKCIAGEHSTGAIFCNTENMHFPIVFDHRTVPLQSAEAGRCRCLLDVL